MRIGKAKANNDASKRRSDLGRVEFRVPGDPVAFVRPQFNRGRGYTDKSYADYKKHVRIFARREIAAGGFEAVDSGPVAVDLVFWLPRPKSSTRKTKANRPHVSHTKPDIDNLAKSILDAVEGLAFANDSQVAYLCVRKFVCGDSATAPGVDVSIRRIDATAFYESQPRGYFAPILDAGLSGRALRVDDGKRIAEVMGLANGKPKRRTKRKARQ